MVLCAQYLLFEQGKSTIFCKLGFATKKHPCPLKIHACFVLHQYNWQCGSLRNSFYKKSSFNENILSRPSLWAVLTYQWIRCISLHGFLSSSARQCGVVGGSARSRPRPTVWRRYGWLGFYLSRRCATAKLSRPSNSATSRLRGAGCPRQFPKPLGSP